MSLVYVDRVQETTVTTGLGSYALAGAVTGYQAFSAVGDGNTCYYAITDGVDWEVGLGTYTLAGTTLARTSIKASSNANAAVNWSAGTKNIWLDFPAFVANYLAGGITGSGPVVLGSAPSIASPALTGTPTYAGSSSGTTGLQASASASGTLTLPAATDTLIGKATTDTLTNKTYDTAGAGNSFKINGTAITAVVGSGSVVLATSPTLTTPNLGTPSAVTLTNATGLPISTGVSGLGTGVATFLATPSSANLRAAVTDETGTGLLYFQGGALGTPSSGTLTNATGLPISTGVSGLGTGVATFLATPSSANLRAALTDETGTGAAYFQGGDLGTPSAGVLTNVSGTAASLTSGTTKALDSATTTINVDAATAPSAGQVLTATDSTHATWQTPSSSGISPATSGTLPVGVWAFCTQASGGTMNVGDTCAGSAITPKSNTPSSTTAVSGPAQTGTWKNVGAGSVTNGGYGFFIRTA